ncbi:MAG: hypothetical protein FWD49_03055 [Firmicutes bacterium]|nr:hypothetical protein [Bacillota bacterium]
MTEPRIIKKNDIVKEYKLDHFVSDSVLKRNIAFALQNISFYLELVKNNPLPKSLQATTCKELAVKTFAVLEGMMLGATDSLKWHCCKVECRKEACDLFFNDNTAKFIKFSTIKAYLKRVGMLEFSESGKWFVNLAKDLRNNVHIGKSATVDSENPFYGTDFIESSLNIIKEVSSALAENFAKQKATQRCLSGCYKSE